MIKEIQYINIRRVLDNLHEHPLLSDVTLEQAVRYVIRFIGLHGYPKMFQDKVITLPIKNFRGLLPCDLVSIVQVRDQKSEECLRAMTDSFGVGHQSNQSNQQPHPQSLSSREGSSDFLHHIENTYIPEGRKMVKEPAFKTQGRVIYTSFPEGCVEIAYRSIPVDEDGFPLLIDNENYLAALEAFIKMQVFTIKFDTGKINANVLQNAQQDYAWRAMELSSEFMTPSYSEAEALARFYQTLIPSMRQFDQGFESLGNREYIRRH